MSPNYPFFFLPEVPICRSTHEGRPPWNSCRWRCQFRPELGHDLTGSRKKHVEKPNQNAHLILTKNVPAKTRVQPAKWGSDLTKKELIISVHCIRCIIASWVLKGGLSSKHGELNRNNCYVCTYIYIYMCVCVCLYIYIYTRKNLGEG